MNSIYKIKTPKALQDKNTAVFFTLTETKLSYQTKKIDADRTMVKNKETNKMYKGVQQKVSSVVAPFSMRHHQRATWLV